MPQLDALSTTGYSLYTIPSDYTKFDVIPLGGGGAGQGGGAGFANGRAGAAGAYGAGLTLTRGVDFPANKTTFKVYVGTAGLGAPGNGSAGSASALAVEFGAAGPGATGSGTGSVALSWTHTPNGYDNYVIVSVAATVAGGSFSTHTRAATYGGVAMTSLGVVDRGASTGGWVQSFGIAITPGAAPSSVSVTMSKAAAVYSSVKANSVSYGNVNTATVSAITATQSGSTVAGANGNPGVGGVIVGAISTSSATFGGAAAGMAHQFINNTSPAFLIIDSGATTNTVGTTGVLVGVSTTATLSGTVMVTLTPRTAVLGAGGAANSITWVSGGRGGSPGNKTFNGQTYVGGIGSLNTGLGALPAAATAPGAGGGGSGGFLLGLTSTGGNGSAGRVWIFAYAKVADASRPITASPTATTRFSARTESLPTTINAFQAAAIQFNARPTSIPTAITATGTGEIRKGILVAGSLAVTASATATARLTGFFSTALTVTAARPVTPSLVYRVSATQSTIATTSGTGRLTGRFTASQTITANRTTTGLRNALVNTSQTITATTTSTGLRNALVNSTSTITATRTAASTQNASAMAGFSGANLVIPGYDSSRLSTEQFRSPGTSTRLVGNNNYVSSAFFPPYIPAVAGDRFYYETWVLGHPNNTVTNAGGLFLGGGAYTEANAIIQYPNIGQSQISPSMNGVWQKRSGIIVMPPGTAKAYFFVQLNPQAGTDIFYFDDSVVAKLDPIAATIPAAISRRQSLQGTLGVSFSIPAISNLQGKLSAAQTISSTGTVTGLRNALVNASQSITSTRPSNLNGSFILSAGTTAVTATATAAARLLAVGNASRPVTFAFTSTALRTANVASSLNITAGRTSVVKWDSFADSSQSITTNTPAVGNYDPTAEATTLPGFPYELPLRFGVTVRAIINAFITRFQYGDVDQAVTATRPASLQGSLTGNATLAITANRPVTGLRNTFASASQTITAGITSAGLRNARVGAAQAITNTRNVTGLRNAIVSDLTTNVTAARSASGVTNTRAASNSLSVSASFGAAIRLTGSLASLTAITAARTVTGLRNAQVAAIRPITATITPGSLAASLRINTALTVQTQEPTSVTEILTAVGGASGIVTALRPATSTRNARVDASLTVTANRPTTVKWDSRGNSSLLSVTALRASYAVYSTTVVAATMPGLPYELPLRFGVAFRASTNATAGNAFTAIALPATIVANRTATPRALWSTSASQSIAVSTNPGFPYELPFQVGGLQFVANISTTLTANRPVVATPTSQAKLAGRLSGSLSGTTTFTSAISKNIPVQATLGIAAGITSVGRLSAFAAGTLAVSNTRPAEGLRSVFADSSMAVSATASTTALRNARVSSSTTITGSTSGSVVAGFKTAASVLLVAGQTAASRLLASANATQITSFALFGSTQRTANVAASQLITQTSTSIANYNPRVSGSLATAFGRNTLLNLSTSISATTLPGLPYILPYRFGVTFSLGRPSSIAVNYKVDAGLVVTAGAAPQANMLWRTAALLSAEFETNYPGLPYQLPFRLGKLDTIANVSALVQGNRSITAVSPSTARMLANIASSTSTFAGFAAAGTRNALVASSLTVTGTTTSTQRMSALLASSTSTSVALTTTGLRSTFVASSLTASSVAAVTGLRKVFANASAGVNVNVTGSNTLAAFLKAAMPLVITPATSVTEILSAVGFASELLTATATGAIKRQTFFSTTLSVTATRPSSVAWRTNAAANLAVSAPTTPQANNATKIVATTLPGFPYELPLRFGVAIRANTTGSISQVHTASASLTVIAGRTAAVKMAAKTAASLVANLVTNYPGFPYNLPYLLGRLNTTINVSQGINAFLGVNVVLSSNLSQQSKINASRQIIVNALASATQTQLVSANLNAKATTVPCFPYNLPILLSSEVNAQASVSRRQKLDAQLNVIATRPSNMGILVKGNVSLAVNFITNYPGFPYTLPHLLGRLNLAFTQSQSIAAISTFSASANVTASRRQLLSATRVISANAQGTVANNNLISANLIVRNALVPCFPYELPITLSPVPNARATALRDAKVAAQLSVTGNRPSLLGLLFKGDVGLNVNFVTNYPGLPYTFPYLLGNLSAKANLSQSIQSLSVINSVGTANFSQNQKLQAARQITFSTQITTLRNATISASLLAKSSAVPTFPYSLPIPLSAIPNRQASATREAKVSASRVVNVKGMSPTFMPGLPFTFPFRFNQSPAPVMTLETRVPSLPTIITFGQSAESQRIANVVANQTVSATRQSNISIATSIDADLTVSPTQTVVPNTFPYTLPYIFAAIRAAPPAASAKISVKATSLLLAINARMYGFPYRLPLKLGPVNAVLRRQFKSVLDVSATATLTAGNKLSALIVANRSVSVGIPASAKYRTPVSVNTRPGFPFDLPLLLRGASFDITANRPAVAAKIHFVQSSVSIVAGTGNPIPRATYGGRVNLPIVSAITARMNSSCAFASEQTVTAIITAFSKYRVNSAAALAVTINRSTVAGWYTNSNSLLEVEAEASSSLTFAANFSANRPTTVTPTVAIGSLHSLLSSAEGRFALAAAAKNNARVNSLLAINVIQSASMQMRARIASLTTLFVAQPVAVKADYKLAMTLGVISTALSSVAWRSSMASQSTIQALADTNESQNQDISSGHTSAYTNILSSALRTQYLAGINTSVTAPRSATTVLVYDGRASVTTNFSASASIKRDAYCEAVLGVSATADTWPIWEAYAESTQLNIQTNPETRGVKIRYLVSIGTPAIVTTEASAEMYHSAGSFIPFFYAGG